MSEGGAAGPDVAGALVAALAPGSGIGLAVHDETLRLLLISPSLAELAGAPAEAQLGRRLTETLPGEVGEVAEASLRQVAATREPLLALAPAVEAGRERGWLISVYPLAHAGRDLIAVIALHVTESRRAQERLQRSRELLAEAQRMAGVGSWSWDVEADSWTWSEELYRLTGHPAGTPPPDLAALLAAVPGEGRNALRRAAAAVLRDKTPREIAFPVLRPDGTRRILRGRAAPIRGDHGAVVRVDGFAQDVTELSRAEARQGAAAALGQLALSGLPMGVLLRHAVDAVATELQLEHAVIAESRADRAELVMRAVSSGPGPAVDGHEIVFGPDSLAAHVLRARAPVVVRDWEDETRLPYPGLGRRRAIRSSAAVVVGPREAPLGVLSAHSSRAGQVGDEGVAFMETVASIVASAAERLTAEEEVAEQSAARGRLVAQTLDAEDRVRREISEALHDGPLQDLLALGHDVSRLRPAADGDEEHLERVRDGIARAVRQIREVMLDLHPVVLQVGGLESALRAICAQHARDGGYECHVEIDPRAAGIRDELVLSLARELLRNVAKHASAASVDVAVRHSPEGIVLEVTDDGVGFARGRLREALGQGHIGVGSSRERAEAIGGSMRVGPRPDGAAGTRAIAVLPLPRPG